jgi:nicotinamide-nucleotide amidase
MPSVEIIAVGTEMLLGQLLDTNTAYIAAHLADAGIDVYATHAVGDNRGRVAAAIRSSLHRADGVITTGGLGPTVDDLTKEAVCDALGVGVELYEPALAHMEAVFAAHGLPMRPNNRKQAELPQGSRALDNPNGTAPGFIAFTAGEKFVACMPGVPREMKPMLADQVVPFLRERFGARERVYTRILHTIGIGESEIDHRIDDVFRRGENPKIAVLAHDFRADVKIMAKAASEGEAEAMIAPLQDDLEARLSGYVFGCDDSTPASAVLDLLRELGRTLAVAESCTGGLLSAALTSVPGASLSFKGGVVAYDNAVKVSQLGVDAGTLASAGAVSEAAAREMARGARERLGASFGMSTTGIAGPEGGSVDKPVGLVWVGLDDGEARAQQLHLRGDRETIARRATTAALAMLWRHLRASTR